MGKIVTGDGLTATFGGTAIDNAISVTIGGRTLEDILELEAQTATGKKGQVAGSRYMVGDTVVTCGSDTTHWGLSLGNAGCTSIANSLVLTVCYGGATTTLTLESMVFAGNGDMSLEQRTESTSDLTFQHEDLDGTSTYISFS